MPTGVGAWMSPLNHTKDMMNSSQSIHVKFPACLSDKKTMIAGKGHHCPALFLL